MSIALQEWLEQLPAFSGLHGAYVVEAGTEPEVRSWSDPYDATRIRALHRQIRDVVEVLGSAEMPARKLRWIFADSVVYFERRRDGAGLGLITTHEPWTGEGDIITRLIQEFRHAG